MVEVLGETHVFLKSSDSPSTPLPVAMKTARNIPFQNASHAGAELIELCDLSLSVFLFSYLRNFSLIEELSLKIDHNKEKKSRGNYVNSVIFFKKSKSSFRAS